MIEFSTELPRVLTAPNPDNSISMLRALKQIRNLLELVDQTTEQESDQVNASIDDVETMIEAVK